MGGAVACYCMVSCSNETVSVSPTLIDDVPSYRTIQAEPARPGDKNKISGKLLNLPKYVSTDTRELDLEIEISPAAGVMIVAPGHVGEGLAALQIEFPEKGNLDISVGPYPDAVQKSLSLYQGTVSVYDKPVLIPLKITLPDPSSNPSNNYHRVYGVIHFQTVSDNAPPSISALKIYFPVEVR
jgi:hypothetical protein